MKGLEWLKEEIWKQDIVMDKGYIYTDDLIFLLDSFDEPEVLSQEWIDKHKYRYDNIEVVGIKDLQNLLVPKQEELESKIKVLIEAYKQEDGAYSNPENGWISGFVEDLKNLVAEEPLYHALIKGHELVRNSSKYWIHDTEYQGDVFVGHRIQMLPRFKERLTMPDWNELGINDTNADFVRVDE